MAGALPRGLTSLSNEIVYHKEWNDLRKAVGIAFNGIPLALQELLDDDVPVALSKTQPTKLPSRPPFAAAVSGNKAPSHTSKAAVAAALGPTPLEATMGGRRPADKGRALTEANSSTTTGRDVLNSDVFDWTPRLPSAHARLARQPAPPQLPPPRASKRPAWNDEF